MGMFDFLSNYAVSPQAGTAAIPAVNDPGGLGIQPAVAATAGRPGLTYGDIASTLMKYGSKPGSSGSMFADLPLGPQQKQMMQQQGNNQLMDMGPTLQQQQKQKSMSSVQSAANLFSWLFGGAGGALGTGGMPTQVGGVRG